MKKCCDCNQLKDCSLFGKLKIAKDGLNFRCLECAKFKIRKWREENPEKEAALKLKSKSYYQNNIDKEKSRKKLNYVNNTKKVKQNNKKWADKNPDKVKAKYARWIKNNPGKLCAKTGLRRAAKKLATLKLSKFDSDYIKHLYIQAKELEKLNGIKYHVDHIIPLRNDKVCGLHVPWNLQILEASVNISKSNKII